MTTLAPQVTFWQAIYFNRIVAKPFHYGGCQWHFDLIAKARHLP
jgi:hypothetical protein